MRHAALLALLLQGLAGWPAWRWWLARLRDGSDEPWGVLALLALLATGTAGALRQPPGAAHLWGLAGLNLVLAAAAPHVPPLVHAAGCLLGLTSLLLRASPGRAFDAGGWVLALLALPVLASVQFYLGYPLRLVAAALAMHNLRLLGLPVERAGLDLQLGARVVQVDAPCSGARMLWVGLFLVAVLARAWGLGALRTLLACALGVTMVLLGNAMRVSALVLLETSRVSGSEWLHEAVGVAAFVPVSVALCGGVAWLRSVGRMPVEAAS